MHCGLNSLKKTTNAQNKMEMKQEQMKIISPIAIDMGAKNTGVYLNHFTQGEDPTTSGNIAGKTIVIDSSNITWSQAGRTQNRHQIRSKERRKLAK